MQKWRGAAGVLMAASGALMVGASWQRWAGACGWGDSESAACIRRQDHLYDFIAPSAPWQPIGEAAQWAGWSLVLFAIVLATLPWVLTGRRPGAPTAIALAGAVVATGIVGVATANAGYAGAVVTFPGYQLAAVACLTLPLAVLIRLAVAAHGWARVAAVALVFATPLVAGVTYAVGPFDAQPWSEAISGLLTIGAGFCLLIAAARSGSGRGNVPPVPMERPARESLTR